ncbi:streptomycin biosynthesis protein StrI [Delitschia confertaspora ATCC 74209]|uniref:Streptomycin biosynthesis protein StrI n=1 Tax=Delitschia confertaspora ATCC 74209 TaxID=1513339 RepID=A0A9P4JLZ2_9PLEO|nr:streptomycin biosynthesis protein StrI [Delitschia confertaspora ATCC 74209]
MDPIKRRLVLSGFPPKASDSFPPNPNSNGTSPDATPNSVTPQAPPNNETAYTESPPHLDFTNPPLVLVIGAGSRGTAYAGALLSCSNAIVACVAEPIASKRSSFAKKYIYEPQAESSPRLKDSGEAEFSDWKQWIKYERVRREREKAGEKVQRGIDAVFVCVLDEWHEEVVTGIVKEGWGLSVLCEKPLATTLSSCLNIFQVLKEDEEQRRKEGKKESVFGICHVLRYSPHNMLLSELVKERAVVGDVLGLEHVEPVGWWHFSHSYVRGNWRKESITAPSLLTKSCHDIDFILWLLCSPPAKASTQTPHLPSSVSSTGSLTFFRKERKPKEAGSATNCISCPYEPDCIYSAKKIYLDRHLKKGNTGWPVKIVNPDIEECYQTSGVEAASAKLLESLTEDYTPDAPVKEIETRPWFGRCVWESDNDVCDDQHVTITWDDDPVSKDDNGRLELNGRAKKTAQFHMTAFTEKICERRGRIYGTKGEIEYDSQTITVHDFATGETKVHRPHMPKESGHGGGDEGLIRQFITAVNAVDNQGMAAAEAQRKFLGCDLEEAFRSHAMVFAAEEARKERKFVDWENWWDDKVDMTLKVRENI